MFAMGRTQTLAPKGNANAPLAPSMFWFSVKALARRTVLVIGAAVLLFSLLFVSFSPTVTAQRRPSAQDILTARQTWQQLMRAKGAAATDVRADDRVISGISALTRDATGLKRLDASLSAGNLRARGSMPLPFGLWVNASVEVSGNHTGFPPFRATIGRVVFPKIAGRPLAKLARTILRLKGAEIPPLDELVQTFSIKRGYVLAKVRLPPKSGLVDQVIAARSPPIRHDLVESIYCRIAAQQRAEPVHKLAGLVRRTFADAPRDSAQSYNRASFVALSLAVIGNRAETFTPRAASVRKKCLFPKGPMSLQGRTDLAKHWVFSAALTSVLGAQTAGSLGEWKELNDSLPQGSGFSFVDLAADRAGVQIALFALDRQTAAATKDKLSLATDNYILPEALLRAPEGLDETEFLRRFGSLDQANYAEAVSQIDRILARSRGR